VVAVVAPVLLRTPETIGAAPPRRLVGAPQPLGKGSGAGGPRFVRVVAPMAPWVFGAAAISFAVLPAQVTRHTHGFSVAFAAIVAGVTLAVGVAIQPVARRLDAQSNSLGGEFGLASVVVGLVVGALASHWAQPLLVIVAALLLGAGYGSCLVSGLLEVQRIAPDHHLAGLTATYYALTYIGFAAPVALAAAAGLAGYPTLLLATAGLSALTLLAIHRGPHGGGGWSESHSESDLAFRLPQLPSDTPPQFCESEVGGIVRVATTLRELGRSGRVPVGRCAQGPAPVNHCESAGEPPPSVHSRQAVDVAAAHHDGLSTATNAELWVVEEFDVAEVIALTNSLVARNLD